MRQSDLGSAALELINVNQLQQFHAQLVQRALHRYSYWVERLISFCTRFHAPPLYASRIFESARPPSARAYSNMLRYYSKLGENDETLRLFDRMRKCGLQSDDFPYPIVIKAAGDGGVLFHSHLIKIGVDCGKYVRNVLVNVYGKYGPIEAARQVFDEMPERTVADWNALISGYWNWGNESEAKKLFDSAPEKNAITWTTMVTGCGKMKDLAAARSYFDHMPDKNAVSWNAMLSGYAQNGCPEEALSLLREMESVGIKPNEMAWATLISSCSSRGDCELAEVMVKMLEERKVQLNTVLRTALLDMYAKCGQVKMAQKIFDELGEDRNLVTWNSLISGYMRVGDVIAARDLFDRMPERDIVSWNSMVAGYAQNGQSLLAIELFEKMMDERVIPDEVTMVGVISACANLGALDLGNWVVNVVAANRIKLSTTGYNALIFMYSKCGCMDEAKATFHEMEMRDVVSYNTLITGFAAHGHAIEALKLMQIMKDEGIEPNRITYIGVLTACSHAGLLEEGQKVFESVQDRDVHHYACMVDLLGRVGKLDEARRMVEGMPMQPHAGVYGCLLNASRIHKRIDVGEFAARKLFEIEPENVGNYVLLCNIYAAARLWWQVDRIRKLMKTRGLAKKKSAGWSWIEHDKKVHAFKVSDHSHERSVEIYDILAKLRRKMKAAGYAVDKSNALKDVEDEEKEEMLETHSEKLAVAYGLLVSEAGSVIRVVKNLRICWDCHAAMRMISKLEDREIMVRDNNRFHRFKNGLCSCNDYW